MRNTFRILNLQTLAFIAFLTVATGNGQAQKPTGPRPTLPGYIHTGWNSANGLPQNSVYSVVQTRDGYLWLATQGGLARYNGTGFLVFNRRNTPVFSQRDYIETLAASEDGSLWIGTRGAGVCRYREGRFESFVDRSRLPANDVTALFEDSKRDLWIGTTAGLIQASGGKLRSYGVREGLPGDRVSSIAGDRSGHLWVGTDRGVAEYAEGRFVAMPSLPGDVTALHLDRAGALWAGGRSQLLRRLHGGAVTAYDHLPGFPKAALKVNAIIEDRQGAHWFGTVGGGLCRLRDDAVDCYREEQSGDSIFARP